MWDLGAGVVELPDGRRVRGAGIRKPRNDVSDPDFAVYLLGRDPRVTDWPNCWVRWRDFGVPRSDAQALAVLSEAHERAAYERVEVACGGGVGRTGTALAALAIFGGVCPDEAVSWVRTRYHPRAVETRRQRRWVSTVAGDVAD